MRLTDYTDYSLRTLMYLGIHRENLVTIQDIADAYGISKSHLMKVVHQLGLSGLVETIRGRSGGLRLGKEPEEINIGDVVRNTEPDFMMVECFNREINECVLSPSCELQDVLRRATAAYLQVLSGVTLADLLRNSGALRTMARVQVYPRDKAKAAA
ncbi:Rrf2 family transcriptional regulator [Noviherbaspirillum sp.]|uniref:RrF2 family transcriptional regulator n=1 Tax=Noviherbaspirillum sp. TaxID=1926288 RepID=UPI002D240A7D|nr:Rrf2 family transcriptional regulator [Noviherbaspirillum sp.]HZW21157.1 Rrf2 family transcriptional regulator [Noviherbaspirillum sp.]